MSDSLLNQVLRDRYTIQSEIARGGMGRVYLAWDEQAQKQVAVKYVPFGPNALGDKDLFESALLEQLDHAHLPKVYDAFRDQQAQAHYLVMEYIPGDMLKYRVKKAPFLPDEAVIQILPLLKVLQYLHERTPPIIHRDIKPSNLKFNHDGRLMLVDFGIAKQFVPSEKTRASVYGAHTPDYAPPEQIALKGTDQRSDLFMVGAVLYFMLTGTPPRYSIQRYADNEPMLDPTQMGPLIPLELGQIISKATALEMDARYANASEMYSALIGVLPSLTSSLARGVVQAIKPVMPPTPPIPQPQPQSQSNKLSSILWNTFRKALKQAKPIRSQTPQPKPIRRPPPPPKRIRRPPPPPKSVAFQTPPPKSVASHKPPSRANNQDEDTTVVDNPQVISTRKPDSPSSSYRVANTLISHKPTSGQKTIRLSPDGQMVMKHNYLTEALLEPHIGHISSKLSQQGKTRLFLTGFGTFGGTSLVRATTFKLMKSLEESQKGKALVIRFDTSNHNDLHEYQLVVNENYVDSIAYPFDENSFSQKLDEMLGQEANLVRAEANSRTNRFRGMTALFAQGEQNHTNSAYSDVITHLISQVLKLLESGSDKNEIRQAIENLLTHPSSSETKQIILIIDWVEQEDPMQRLFNSPFVRDRFHNLELSLIVLVRYEAFSRWSDSFRKRIRESSLMTYHYVERLWDKRFDIKSVLNEFMETNSSALSKKDAGYFDNFLAHLTYKARGSTARLMRELKKDYLTHDGQQMVMNLEEIYERKREEVEHNVDMQRLLDRNWSKIIGKKRLKGTEKKDRAKIGLYNVVEWIRDREEPFDRAELHVVAAQAQQEITISDSKYAREKILAHLLRLLVEHDYLRYDAQTGHYELADEDHWHDIEDVDEADEVDEVDDAFVHVAIVGDVTLQEEDVNMVLAKIAFELVSAGHRLVLVDTLPISVIIRQKLANYMLVYEDQVSSEQKPLLLIQTTKNEVTDYESEEVKSATDERQALEILLEEADVVVFAQRERAHDSVFAWQKVKSEAKKEEVAIIPVGAIGGVSAHVWDEVNHHLADYYDRRIEKEIFAKIGPSQRYVPDVARAVVEMVALLGE